MNELNYVPQTKATTFAFSTMEELKWSGTRGVAGVHCVHYIEQMGCTARFATRAI